MSLIFIKWQKTWVVSQNMISYFSAAELMERVTIQTKLLSVTNKNLFVEAIMWDEDKTMIKAVLWSRFTHFNLRTKKSHEHSEELLQFFNSIICLLPEEVSFDERAIFLRQASIEKNSRQNGD
jgi:acyl-CoA thioester hydrolase